MDPHRENVGFGPDTTALQNAFMNSPPHRANILGDYNRVGVGAAFDGNGTLWVTLDFIKGTRPRPAPREPFGQFENAAGRERHSSVGLGDRPRHVSADRSAHLRRWWWHEPRAGVQLAT